VLTNFYVDENYVPNGMEMNKGRTLKIFLQFTGIILNEAAVKCLVQIRKETLYHQILPQSKCF
jgi:hypothetical protein